MTNSFVDDVGEEPTSVDKVEKVKQSFYFPAEMLLEIRDEAVRLERPMSWVMQRAWKVARSTVQSMPANPPIESD